MSRISVENLEEVKERLGKLSEAIDAELRLTLKKSIRDLQLYAIQHHKFKSKTGNLEHAIETAISNDGFTGEVFLNEGINKYGRFVHEGVNHSWVIVHRFKKSLRWPIANGFAFAKKVTHPPMQADAFIDNAGNALRDEINNNFNRSIFKAFRKAGLA